MMLSDPGNRRKSVAMSLFFILTGMTAIGMTEAVSVLGSSWFSSSSSAEATAASETNTADILVSPIINRELETSIVAHSWPSNEQNIFCEAYAYHHQQDDESAAFQFLSNLNSNREDQDAMSRVLAASPLSQSHKSLLKFFLATRASSPLCESHRGLARQALVKAGRLSMSENVRDAFAVVHPSGNVLFDTMMESYFQDEHGGDSSLVDLASILLPDEPVLGNLERDDLVVLYANLGTKAFQKAFQVLIESNARFVVRHMGVVDFEEERGKRNANYTSTILQGYGVRLDIRNLEYKVFDDRSGVMSKDDGTGASGLVNLTAKPAMKIPIDFLAGVNLTALGVTEGDAVLYDVWKVHGDQQAQESIIPPLWQRRNLGVQAATAIASSKDPLAALEEISQNLPSLASTLVHVQVDENIRQGAQFLEEERLLRTARVYVDGRAFALDRPTFNLFELLNVLKSDQEQLEVMEKKLGPLVGMSALADVKNAWASGNDFLKNADDDTMQGDAITVYRIDVHKGNKRSIMYLNDVENDPQYTQWTKSLRQMFMNMQFGMPPAVRRNLFTVMAVVDPAKSPSNGGLSLGFSLIQNSFPARVGVLVVDEDDVSKCAEWLAANSDSDGPCPTTEILSASTEKEDLVDMPATAHAVHRLISHFDDLFGNRPGALQAYVEYLWTTIAEQSEEGETLTMSELLSTHGMLMEGMRLYSASEAERKALVAWKENEDEDSTYSYSAALHFAASKRLKPGMSFLNGRPLPDSDDGLGDAFQEEQNFIFGLIMKGEITDSSPRSVYNKLLTGDNVFSKCHPLLLEESTYKFVDHEHGPESLLFAPQTVPQPEAHIVLDVYVDFDSNDDVQFAENVLRVLEDDISTTVKRKSGEGDVKLGYRFISNTPAQSPLCPIFAQASLVGANSLRQLLHDYKLKPDTSVEDLLKSVPNLSPEARERILTISEDVCSGARLGKAVPKGRLMIGNGRVFEPEGTAFAAADLDLLLSLEFEKAHAVTELLGKYMGDTVATVDAVGKVSAFLAEEGTHSKFKRSDPLLQNSYVVDDMRGRLLFNWNDHRHIKHLLPSITVIVDPLSEAAQRISSLLKVFRDDLQLPVRLLLFPHSVLDGDSGAPVASYYRFVGDPNQWSSPKAYFSNLPLGSTLTLKVDVPEPWNVQQTDALQDTDNLRCDLDVGCGDQEQNDVQKTDARHLTRVEYGLKSLLFFGQCYETSHKPPAGLQLTLSRSSNLRATEESASVEIGMDGTTTSTSMVQGGIARPEVHSDTVVMNNVGYWQLQADAGIWDLEIAKNSKGASMFDMMEGNLEDGRRRLSANNYSAISKKRLVMKDFVNKGELLVVRRREGFERDTLFDEENESESANENETINVFSLATGHLYERFLKIMMLSVTKRTSTKVKFWLFENFLSPSFKATATAMAKRIGCEVGFVTYKWPEWLRDQSEKQRTIWGYKILFLDVLFPLDVKKIIYVDADQVVRGDLKELWDMDLEGAPYGYTPFCTSREATLGYQFWRDGFWKQHLQGKPYHISALYVVDLDVFRKTLVGDKLRATYQSLSADPNSLSNLDQDLPNYAQHQVPIFSLPQEWLWCESWCSDETKATAKTIDLCNNPMHKEPKVSMAKRVISGHLFNESWVELDAEVARYEQEYWASLGSSGRVS